MNKIIPITALLTFGFISNPLLASDFAKLDEALPPNGVNNHLEQY